MNPIRFYNRLVFRVSLAILLPSILLSAFLIYILYQNITKLTEEEYINHLHEVNLNYVDLIDLKMDNFASRAKMGANYIENGQIEEKEFLDLTKDITVSDKLIYASAIAKAPSENNLGFFYSYKENFITLKQLSFTEKDDPNYFDYSNLNLDWWSVPSSSLHSGWTLPYYDHEAGKEHMITYFQPYFIKGNFNGIITIDVSLKQLRKVLLETNTHYTELLNARILLFAQDSTIVYANRMELIGTKVDHKLFTNPKWSDEAQIITKAISGKIGRDIYISAEDSNKYLAFYTPVASTNWSTIAIIPYSTIDDIVIAKIFNIAYVLIAFFVLIIIISVVLTRRISNPITQISKQSNTIAAGDYNKKLTISRSGEVGQLANNFNTMSDKLKEREESLLSANKELQTLDDAKNNFLLLASHEIRTPLNGMIGLTSIIKETADEETREMTELLEESINRLNNLSKRALEIVQMQTRGNEFELQEIEVSGLLMEVIESRLSEIKDKEIQLNISPSLEREYIHKGVLEYFTGSLEELISNAVKHNIGERIININVIEKKNQICIIVENSGSDIDPDKISQILKPFGLGEKHNDKNTGLGLSYVWTYLNIINGKMDISSKNGMNTFAICIPSAS